MKFGVSTACFYPQDLLATIRLLAEHNIEFMEIFANTSSEITPEFAKKIEKIIAPCNIKVTSIHPFTSGYEHILLFSDYYKRFEDSVEFYKKYFEFAAMLGARLIVLHGDRRFPEMGGIPDKEYFERYYILTHTAKKFGITVAQENVNMFRSQNPIFLKNMRDYLGDDVDFVFDIKQAIRSKNDPYKVCEAMGNRIIHIHINDNDKNNDCLLPGKGTMDYDKILSQIKAYGYNGKAVIEVYSKNFSNISDIIQSHKFLSDNFCNI